MYTWPVVSHVNINDDFVSPTCTERWSGRLLSNDQPFQVVFSPWIQRDDYLIFFEVALPPSATICIRHNNTCVHSVPWTRGGPRIESPWEMYKRKRATSLSRHCSTIAEIKPRILLYTRTQHAVRTTRFTRAESILRKKLAHKYNPRNKIEIWINKTFFFLRISTRTNV